MAHGKETPRQKMIGMMYLVLTALLALNVSKDVLDAFILVDDGLTKTTTNFFAKNQSLYGSFDEAYQLNPVKVEEWISKAKEVRERSQQLYDFIQECKKEIVIKSEGEKTEAIIDNNEVSLHLINGKDNTDVPAEIMILNKRGTELREKITTHREFLINLIDDKVNYAAIVASIESGTDLATLAGLSLPELQPATQEMISRKIRAINTSTTNPVDLGFFGFDFDVMAHTIRALGQDENIDVIVPYFSADYITVSQRDKIESGPQTIIEVAGQSDKPVIPVLSKFAEANMDVERVRLSVFSSFRKAGLPVYSTIQDLIYATKKYLEWVGRPSRNNH